MEQVLSFFLEAGAASAYLIAKIVLVLHVGRFICSRSKLDQLSGAIAAWLLIQAVQTGIILGLSALSLMHTPYFLGAVTIAGILIYWRTKLIPIVTDHRKKFWPNYFPIAVISCVFLAMWLRSLFFYDYTWDAQTYGIPRLVMWLNAGSVFLHMPTLQLNLFVNEWNAEFNALAYSLASGSYRGFAFGNLEILALFFVSTVWLASLLGATRFWALCLSATLGSAPAVLGLASTIKGDLLACTCILIAAGWLVYFKRKDMSPIAFGLLALSAALAVGAKISVAPLALAILFLAATAIFQVNIRSIWRRPNIIGWGIICGLLFFSSRFWANWILYGNPIKRVAGEKAQFSFAHLVSNAELSYTRLFSVWEEINGQGPMWALSGSMGASAWVITILAVLSCIAVIAQATLASSGEGRKRLVGKKEIHPVDAMTSNRLSAKWLILFATAIVISTAFTMSLSESYAWCFRYFLPGLMLLLIGIGSNPVRKHSFPVLALLIIFSGSAIVINLAITLRPGEVLPTTEAKALLSALERTDTPLKRISLAIDQLGATEGLSLDTHKKLNILIFNNADTSLIPFLGSNAQNRIQTVDSNSDFLSRAVERKWDALAILQKSSLRDKSLNRAFEKSGYWTVVDSDEYLIAVPKSRLASTPIMDLSSINWTPWNASAKANLRIDNGLLEISSDSLVDAGFLSQELQFSGPVIVYASFEGEIAGPGAHAAHLSLHSQRPLITLPSGKYTSETTFQRVIPRSEDGAPRRLSFGLGGWSTGSGHLRLVKLQIYPYQTLDLDPSVAAQTPPSKTGGVFGFFAPLLSIFIYAGCAILGRGLLSYCGLRTYSWTGASFVTGYGVLGLLLLISLRYLGSPNIGAMAFAGLMGVFAVRQIRSPIAFFRARLNHAQQPVGASKKKQLSHQYIRLFLTKTLLVTVVISWVAAVGMTYSPVAGLESLAKYQLPDIYDLPKHIFAQLSIYRATDWPPPSPFYSGQIFSYNFLFYYPPALIAKLSGNPLMNFQTFAIAVLAVAVALPMTIFDIVRHISRSNAAALSAILFATWAGGLTPLWLHNEPSIGFFLYAENLITSKIYIDELFQSIIYVPQHIFSILCGLSALLLLANVKFIQEDARRICLAGVLVTAGCLSSLLLIPHLLIFYGVTLILAFARLWRSTGNFPSGVIYNAKIVTATIFPFALTLPFLIDALQWSNGTADLLIVPTISSQWLYIFSALGLALPFAIFRAILSTTSTHDPAEKLPGNSVLKGLYVFTIVGVVGILFAGYPDAGIKSGLWIRIAIVPLASIGISIFIGKFRAKSWPRIVALSSISMFFFAAAAINYPTTAYFIRSAYTPMNADTKAFVEFVRNLPQHSRIVFFSTDQILVSLVGRPIDFDMSPIRPDSYMPPIGRDIVAKFWHGLAENDSETWLELAERYDYVIAPIESATDMNLAKRYSLVKKVSGYSVYANQSLK